MRVFPLKAAAASLIAIAAAACTTTGIGTGQAIGQNLGAQFSWTENGGTSGRMIAQLTTANPTRVRSSRSPGRAARL